MAVELVPPFLGRSVEAGGVEGGNGVGALEGVLCFGVGVVGGIGFNLIPCVELIGIVGWEEVAGSELEGVVAFKVAGGRVGAVGWDGGFGGV